MYSHLDGDATRRLVRHGRGRAAYCSRIQVECKDRQQKWEVAGYTAYLVMHKRCRHSTGGE